MARQRVREDRPRKMQFSDI